MKYLHQNNPTCFSFCREQKQESESTNHANDHLNSWYLNIGNRPLEDAFRFAPSGDIYSYFERRPTPSTTGRFAYPLVYEMKKALGGSAHSRK